MTKQDLLKLITEHPEANIIVKCGEGSYWDAYAYTYHFEEELVFTFEKLAVYGEKVYEDKEDLKADLEDDLFDVTQNMDEQEYLEFINKELIKYEFLPYIVIIVG